MTCPHCAHFHDKTLPELKTKYIDTGKARLIFREFPFDPRAEAGFMLARCSNDNYFPMVDVLFKQQDAWAARRERQGRAAANLQACRFYTGEVRGLLDGPEASGRCQVGAEARRRRISTSNSTPTFFINGNTYKGAMSIAELSAIIDGML